MTCRSPRAGHGSALPTSKSTSADPPAPRSGRSPPNGGGVRPRAAGSLPDLDVRRTPWAGQAEGRTACGDLPPPGPGEGRHTTRSPYEARCDFWTKRAQFMTCYAFFSLEGVSGGSGSDQVAASGAVHREAPERLVGGPPWLLRPWREELREMFGQHGEVPCQPPRPVHDPPDTAQGRQAANRVGRHPSLIHRMGA